MKIWILGGGIAIKFDNLVEKTFKLPIVGGGTGGTVFGFAKNDV